MAQDMDAKENQESVNADAPANYFTKSADDAVQDEQQPQPLPRPQSQQPVRQKQKPNREPKRNVKREPKQKTAPSERKMYDVLKILRLVGIGCFVLALILLIAGFIQQIIHGDTTGITVSFVMACVVGGLLGFLLKRK